MIPFVLYSSEPLKIAFTALHLPSLSTVELNSDQYVPLASTFKLPLAIYCLQKEPSLDVRLKIAKTDLRDGAGIMKFQFTEGVEYSLKELIELMMVYSDNTATDILLARCGGPTVITQWLRNIGIEKVVIQNSCLEILTSYYGIKDLPSLCTLETFEIYKQQVKPIEQQKAAQAYLTSMPDRTTSQAIILLLKKLMLDELLSDDLKVFLLHCMVKSEMGLNRIRKHLPPQLLAGDKEGTLGILAADVGVLVLPGHQSYILIAAYSYGGSSLQEREDLIAELSLKAYQQFSNQKL